MKKYFTLMVLAIFGGLLMMSCEMNEVVDRDIQDNDTYPVMKDVTGTFTSSGNYTLTQSINIANSDVVLVYRNYNSNSSSSAVWQLIPKTYYLSNNGELDYNFQKLCRKNRLRGTKKKDFFLGFFGGKIPTFGVKIVVGSKNDIFDLFLVQYAPHP